MHLRSARAEDQQTIRQMIHDAHLNPMGLDWQHFTIAEEDGKIIGIGQIKQHGDGSRELASIAVVPARWGAGIGSEIIRTLLKGETGPLFLMCRGSLQPFYARFGFRQVGWSEMTPYFRRIDRLAGIFVRLGGRRAGPTIMKRDIVDV